MLRKGRAYSFSYTNVKDIYDRYHQTGGTGGQVVEDQQYQGCSEDHLENTGGHEVVQEGGNATSKPPLKDEVVATKSLGNNEDDHLTTKTTCLDSDKNDTRTSVKNDTKTSVKNDTHKRQLNTIQTLTRFGQTRFNVLSHYSYSF